MKVLIEKYPKGSLKYQKTDGRYVDEYLYSNLRIMAKKITDDMTFLGVIFSSTLEVGTGKSVFATQIGEIWEEIIKKEHNIDLNYGTRNIVWRAKELIAAVLEEKDGKRVIPKYSFVLLDEWEDAHYWSELGMTLRAFFRKCRQLNLFILIVIPNFFQLNMSYAIGRSIFAIDVHFGDNFSRGHFKFYGFDSKRKLFLNGKKFHNYKVKFPDFDGQFFDGYGVDKGEYLKSKAEDIKKWDAEEVKAKSPEEIRAGLIRTSFEYLKKNKGLSQKDYAEALGISQTSLSAIILRKSYSNLGTSPNVKV